eukprot:5610559-Prymnesium_polylepis.1
MREATRLAAESASPIAKLLAACKASSSVSQTCPTVWDAGGAGAPLPDRWIFCARSGTGTGKLSPAATAFRPGATLLLDLPT